VRQLWSDNGIPCTHATIEWRNLGSSAGVLQKGCCLTGHTDRHPRQTKPGDASATLYPIHVHFLKCMPVQDVAAQTWQQKVVNSEMPVVVNFSAVRCGFCRALEPLYSRLSNTKKTFIEGSRITNKDQIDWIKEMSRNGVFRLFRATLSRMTTRRKIQNLTSAIVPAFQADIPLARLRC
jgi:hypothetical protein